MTVTISETSKPIDPPLLGPGDPPPFEVLNRDGTANVLITCDHAGNAVPDKLDNLGMDTDMLKTHFAWDIGVRDLSVQVAQMMDAPLIMGTYSRLVVDLNRRLDHPTAFVHKCDGHPVPRNVLMSEEEKQLRIDEIYTPYHDEVSKLIDGFLEKGTVPVVISFHSFTRMFFKQERPWEIGVLWVQDPRVPVPVIEWLKKQGLCVGDNEPYDARILRGTTINHHADARKLPNILYEIRNDLLENDDKIKANAELLCQSLQHALQDKSVYSYYDGPEFIHDPEEGRHYFEELIRKAKKGE